MTWETGACYQLLLLLRLCPQIYLPSSFRVGHVALRERGFIKAAGVSENTILLEHLIRKVKGQGKGSLVVAFLDLQKAFDTVSHCLIERGLERLGVPEQFILVERLVYRCKYCLRYGSRRHQTHPNQGVKQEVP